METNTTSRGAVAPQPAHTVRTLPGPLRDAAVAPYRAAGHFAYRWARGKLGNDPAFGTMIANHWIAPQDRVVDIGCGQGLLASLLRANGHQGPITGIELMQVDVDRARRALGDAADFQCIDMRKADYARLAPIDTAVILDVLHYVPIEAQDRLLRELHAAMRPGGRLLLRIGDADGGLAFRCSQFVDHVVTLARGHGFARMYCRPLSTWRRVLEDIGFQFRVQPLSQGTPFANVLLDARRS